MTLTDAGVHVNSATNFTLSTTTLSADDTRVVFSNTDSSIAANVMSECGELNVSSGTTRQSRTILPDTNIQRNLLHDTTLSRNIASTTASPDATNTVSASSAAIFSTAFAHTSPPQSSSSITTTSITMAHAASFRELTPTVGSDVMISSPNARRILYPAAVIDDGEEDNMLNQCEELETRKEVEITEILDDSDDDVIVLHGSNISAEFVEDVIYWASSMEEDNDDDDGMDDDDSSEIDSDEGRVVVDGSTDHVQNCGDDSIENCCSADDQNGSGIPDQNGCQVDDLNGCNTEILECHGNDENEISFHDEDETYFEGCDDDHIQDHHEKTIINVSLECSELNGDDRSIGLPSVDDNGHCDIAVSNGNVFAVSSSSAVIPPSNGVAEEEKEEEEIKGGLITVDMLAVSMQDNVDVALSTAVQVMEKIRTPVKTAPRGKYKKLKSSPNVSRKSLPMRKSKRSSITKAASCLLQLQPPPKPVNDFSRLESTTMSPKTFKNDKMLDRFLDGVTERCEYPRKHPRVDASWQADIPLYVRGTKNGMEKEPCSSSSVDFWRPWDVEEQSMLWYLSSCKVKASLFIPGSVVQTYSNSRTATYVCVLGPYKESSFDDESDGTSLVVFDGERNLVIKSKFCLLPISEEDIIPVLREKMSTKSVNTYDDAAAIVYEIAEEMFKTQWSLEEVHEYFKARTQYNDSDGILSKSFSLGTRNNLEVIKLHQYFLPLTATWRGGDKLWGQNRMLNLFKRASLVVAHSNMSSDNSRVGSHGYIDMTAHNGIKIIPTPFTTFYPPSSSTSSSPSSSSQNLESLILCKQPPSQGVIPSTAKIPSILRCTPSFLNTRPAYESISCPEMWGYYLLCTVKEANHDGNRTKKEINSREETNRMHKLLSLELINPPEGAMYGDDSDSSSCASVPEKPEKPLKKLKEMLPTVKNQRGLTERENMVGNQRRTIDQIDKDTGLVVHRYPNKKEAAAAMRVSTTGILGCCVGKHNLCGNFIWKFSDRAYSPDWNDNMVDVPALLSIRLSRKYQLKKRKRNESAQWSANVDVSLSGDLSLTDSCKRKSSDMNDQANRKTIKIHRGENGNERGAEQHGSDGLPITFREGEEGDNDDGDEDEDEINDSEDERLDDSAILNRSDPSKNNAITSISKPSKSTAADGNINSTVSDNRKDEDDMEGDDNNDNEVDNEDNGVINSSEPSVELAGPHGGLEWNQNPDSRRNMDKVEVTTGLTYSFIAMITMMRLSESEISDCTVQSTASTSTHFAAPSSSASSSSSSSSSSVPAASTNASSASSSSSSSSSVYNASCVADIISRSFTLFPEISRALVLTGNVNKYKTLVKNALMELVVLRWGHCTKARRKGEAEKYKLSALGMSRINIFIRVLGLGGKGEPSHRPLEIKNETDYVL